jgi:hypothetical protein
MNKTNPYSGPERRIHKLYVTRNTEYHVRKGVCVAVRPRRSEAWFTHHHAIRKHLDGVVQFGSLVPIPGPPALGQRLYFAEGEEDVLTSSVVAILRPPKKVVAQYPADP